MKDKIKFIILLLVFIILIVGSYVFNNTVQEKKITDSLIIENTISNQTEKIISNVIHVDEQTFEDEVLKSSKVVLVDFYADWCGPCRILSPVVEAISNENDDIKVVKVNVDENSNLSIKYEAYSIPLLVIIKDGEVVAKNTGLITKADLQKLINEVK